MPRYELPPDLTPEEQRIAIAALERTFARPGLSPWVLAGRAQALRMGSLQVRHQSEAPWRFGGHVAFASRGTDRLMGRGDAK
jgi:hypothetical protein